MSECSLPRFPDGSLPNTSFCSFIYWNLAHSCAILAYGMTELLPLSPTVPEQSVRDVERYLAVIRRPVLIGVGAIFFLYIISSVSFLVWPESLLRQLGLVVLVGVMLRAGWRCRAVRRDAVAAAAAAGALTGLGVALIHLGWFWSWWFLPQLIVLPLGAAVVGGGVGWLVSARRRTQPSAPEII